MERPQFLDRPAALVTDLFRVREVALVVEAATAQEPLLAAIKAADKRVELAAARLRPAVKRARVVAAHKADRKVAMLDRAAAAALPAAAAPSQATQLAHRAARRGARRSVVRRCPCRKGACPRRISISTSARRISRNHKREALRQPGRRRVRAPIAVRTGHSPMRSSITSVLRGQFT